MELEVTAVMNKLWDTLFPATWQEGWLADQIRICYPLQI